MVERLDLKVEGAFQGRRGMKKIVIDVCDDCKDYMPPSCLDPKGYCTIKDLPVIVNSSCMGKPIPSWCPLEDAEEKK